MKTSLKYLGIITMILATFGCSKDDPITVVPDPLQKEPVKEDPKQEDPVILPTLTSIDPTKGPKATLVTIEGTLFGTDASKVKVFFNEQEATVQTVTDTTITSLVAVGAGTGSVKVIVDGHELAGPEFEYELTVEVSTLAGSIEGDLDGTAEAAMFNLPASATLDSQGNFYLTDLGNHKIKTISPSGEVTTLAGSTPFTDGPANNGSFNNPVGIAIDEIGNVFVADRLNHSIRRITRAGEVSTLAGGEQGFADGIGPAAQFDRPSGLAIDQDNNLYVTDSGNNKIRKIDPRGHVSTLAGSTKGSADGPSSIAKFNFPVGIVVDQGLNLYVADQDNHSIRRISADGAVTTLAGGIQGFQDGSLAAAKFNQPTGLAFDSLGNLYVADLSNNRIRKISPQGIISTLAGGVDGFQDGSGSDSLFKRPFGLVVDAQNNVYVMDAENHRIRKITQE